MAQLESLTRLANVFTDPSCDIEARKKATDSIKDSQELWHTKEYRRFLEVFFDPLVQQLTSTPPQFEDSELHKLRHSVLEVLSKLPPNEVLRPYMPRLLALCLELLRNDNQANGVLAFHVLLDLNKNLVRSQVAGFEGQFTECVAFIEKVYNEFPATYSEAFTSSPPRLPSDFSPTHRSLKMVSECPLPLMFMMQLFPQLAKARVPALLPSMVAAACLRGPELNALPGVPAALWEREQQRRDREASQRAARGGEGQLLPEEKWREQVNDKWREQVLSAVADLKVAQVRTLNFLTMMMRNFPGELEPHVGRVCSALFYLFRSAPDSIAVRRELLAATRYVLTGPQKAACFAGVIDDVLAEGVLLGSSMASMEALRPLSVMTFCEIVHHTRKSFSLEQLGGVVSYLACCVADRSLPFNTQSTCVRLSLNLVECLYQAFKRPDADLAAKKLAQSLLSKILGSFVAKLTALAQDIPGIIAAAREQRNERLSVQGSMRDAANPDTHVVLYLQGPGEKEKEINDCKLIVQNIVFGAKTLLFSILYCTRHYHNVQQHEAAKAAALAAGQPLPAMSHSPPPVGMPEEDVRTCAQLLVAGLSCLKVAAFFGEGKEFCEHFAEIFTVMDPRDFTDVFSVRMGVLFDIMAGDADALTVAAHLVQSSSVGRVFNALLARYLTEHKLALLADHASNEALLVQKLFRLVFLGLTLADGEALLLPTLVSLVGKCLTAAQQQRDPLAYLQLLRILFKHCHASRRWVRLRLQLLRILFKHCHASREPLQALYHELAPQLSGALHTLLAILEGPNCTEQLKYLLVELCLLLPAALRVLVELVLLPRLVKPLALALRGPDELVALGLRTFEVWVDSLNPEYLENALADVVGDIMGALWALLRPSQPLRSHAMAAMQLLGKLGGRNRKFLAHPGPLDYKDNPEHGLRLILTFRPNTSFLVPLDRCVALAKHGLTPAGPGQAGPSGLRGAANTPEMDKYYRGQALQFIQVCLAAVLNLRAPEDAHNAPEDCRGTAFEKLATVLLEGQHPPMARAAVDSLSVFVGTLLKLTAARKEFREMKAAAAADAGPFGAAAAGSDEAAAAAADADGSKAGSKPDQPAGSEQQQQQPAKDRERSASVLDLSEGPPQQQQQQQRQQGKEGGDAMDVDVKQEGQEQQQQQQQQDKNGKDAQETAAADKPAAGAAGAAVKQEADEDKPPAAAAAAAGPDAAEQQKDKSVAAGSEQQQKAEADKAAAAAAKEKEEAKRPQRPAVSNVAAARAKWAQEAAEVLLGVVLNPNNSQRSRQAAIGGMTLLSQQLDVAVSVWLAPVLAAMSPPLMSRRIIPVRSVQTVMGQVSALTWVLSVDPSLLPGGPEVLSVAKEAFALADKEEALLLQRLPGRNLSLEVLTALRVACIDLLNVMMAWEPFRTYPEPAEALRDEITAMMFRALVSDTPAIHAAARRALERLMSLAKIPKHLLQNSLRPILQNLGDYRRLTLRLLHGLGRLLELLSDWFNLTLGERLIEHLKNWLDPDTLLQAGPFQWKSGEEVAIAAAVLDLFWRLPKTAVKFLETQHPPALPALPGGTPPLTAAAPGAASAAAPATSAGAAGAVAGTAAAAGGSSSSAPLGLVVLTIQLEERLSRMPAASSPLPRILTSEYRQPLLKFLDKYPQEGVAYFLEPGRITNPSYFNTFTALLGMPQAGPLRAQLASCEDKLLSLLGQSPKQQQQQQQQQKGQPAAAEPAAAGGGGGAADAGKEQQQQQQQQGADKDEAKQEPGAPADAATAITPAQPQPQQPPAGAASSSSSSSSSSATACRAVQLIELLVRHQPDWLPACPAVFNALWRQWNLVGSQQWNLVGSQQRPMAREALLPSLQLLDSLRIARCMLSYLAAHHEQVEPLLDLFSALGHCTSVDMNLIPEYITGTVASSYSIAHQRRLLLAWAGRFKAFCHALPQISKAAIDAGTPNIFTAGTGSHAELVQCALLSQLVLPLLAAAHEAGRAGEVLNTECLEVLSSVFRVSDTHSVLFGESLRIRMLQLCVELSKAATPSIAANKPLRDVLIKYAWRHLKVPEESPCRHWAFLATVHLLPLVDARASQSGEAQRQRQQQQQLQQQQSDKEKQSDEKDKEKDKDRPEQRQSTAGGGGSTATSMGAVVPSAGGTAAAAAGGGERERSNARPAGTERMVAQVWVSLLRVTQIEPRKGLMREVLDCLVPTLVDKLGTRGDDGKVIWVRYAKKQVLDESGTLSNLLQLWQLVVRHPGVFYDSRAQFMSQMINTLSRIGMPQQASLENRKLSLDLAGLLLAWEAKRRQGLPAAAGAAAAGAQTPGSSRKRAKPEADAEDAAAAAAAAAAEDTEMTDAAPAAAAAAAGEASSEQPAKLIKTEDGSPAPAAKADTPAAAAVPEASAADVPQQQQQQQQQQGGTSLPQRASSHSGGVAAGCSGSGGGDDFVLTPEMENVLVNFLVRMAFLIGESQDKDADMQALHQHTLKLLSQALALFPHVSVKLSAFLERLLQAQAAKSPMPALITGWEVMSRALDAQPHLLAKNAGKEFVMLLSPCFKLRQQHVQQPAAAAAAPAPEQDAAAAAAAAATAAAAAAAAAAELDSDIWDLQSAVLQHVRQCLARGTDPQMNLLVVEAPQQQQQQVQQQQQQQHTYASSEHLLGICCALSLLSAIHEVCPEALIGVHMPPLVKLLNRCSRDVCANAQNGQMHQAHYQQVAKLNREAAAAAAPQVPDAAAGKDSKQGSSKDASKDSKQGTTSKLDAAPAKASSAAAAASGAAAAPNAAGPSGLTLEPAATAADIPTPEYGTVAWVLNAALLLIGSRAFSNSELKKSMLQSIIIIITANGAKYNEPVLFMRIMLLYQDWLQLPPQLMTVKEAVLLLQRLAYVQDRFDADPATCAKWHCLFLDIVYNICTSSTLPPELSDEVFSKVERLFLLGLRAADPVRRARFFSLYHKHIAAGLFERLQFIICVQEWQSMSGSFWLKSEWQSMSGSFWLKSALDLILAVLKEDDPIMLAPNSAQAPPLLPGTRTNVFNPSVQHPQQQQQQAAAQQAAAQQQQQQGQLQQAGTDNPQQQQQQGQDGCNAAGGAAAAFPVSVREADVPGSIKGLLEGHLEFLGSTGQLSVKHMMGPLREYAQVDPCVAYHLWVLVFPIVWATLAKQQQINLAKPIISLLSKEYHQRQAMARPNVVQALLEGISLSQPQPKIPPELIKFLGKAFNAWHIAIPLLESHVIIFPDETRCFDALAELYRLVGEEDMMAGLWRRRCCRQETRTALSLLQLGMAERAQALLVELTSQVSSGAIVPSARGETSNGEVPRGEIVLWVESWVGCSKALTQWDVLADYSRAADNTPLAMDCLWRLHDWETLSGMLANNQGQMEPAVSSCLLSAYAALREVNQETANTQIDKGFQYALAKWWQLPDTGCAPQLALLQVFQQLVELRESGRVLADVMNQQQRSDQQYSDTKDILETWRLRTPNEWDSLVHWQDVLLWRNHIYNVVIGAFNSMQEIAPQLHQMGYRDKAWSVNKLGHIAYKHGCPDVCITVINNMYGYNAMEVQEAFVKIKEQARAYLALPLDLRAGLNMLNTTNLDYFAAHHQAEIFRLKALFMAEPGMGDLDGANSALSTALCLWRQCPDAWLSWGQLCDARFEADPAGPASQQLLQYAAHCYVQGIKLSTAPLAASGMKARNEEALQASIDLLPRLLHLLSFDDRDGVVGEELQKAVDERSLPPWIWFMWIPQLLTSLTRPETHRVKPILKQLAEVHPQSIYYSLRTFVLGLREAAQRALQEHSKHRAGLEAAIAAALEAAGGDEQNEAVRNARAALAALAPSSDTTAFDGGKEVMERLRSQHPVLGSTMEGLLAEVGSKFVPRPLERLLAVVTALLHRCYKLPVANSSAVPDHMRREMAGVCRACFASETSKLQARNMQPVELREGFLHDLNPESRGFPHTLGELAERLKAWRNRLTTELEAAMPHSLRLEEECRALQDIQLSEVELPGQYLAGHEVTPDSSIYLEAISSNVAIVRRSASSFRRLSLICSDGITRHMLVQTGQNSTQGAADERMMQLLRLLNRLLERSPESRRRLLAWHTPIIVPVWPQVRLFEEEASYCSYGEAYDINCARFGREPDMPIAHFKKRLAAPDGNYDKDPDGSLRLGAFNEICDKVVSENIFSQYIYKTLPTCNHLWLFKKHFCSQMALSGLLCYMLLLSGRSPSKILFAKDSGRLFQLDLLPLYNDKGMVERIEVVPYRLTRNLATFFTAFGVEGVFIPAQVAAAAALLARNSNLAAVLCQFFREDLLAWTSRKGKGSSGGVHLPSDTLKGLVVKNTQQVLERVRHFAPEPVSEDMLPARPVHHGALELSDAAMSPKTLCRMDPTWMPWY
ncbi:hypothetical protein OEZ86_014371 [Tetradesmus obliquus]|nr:hypothetical protein OEZ86_014371 [Tetradesmus obliquus]